MLRGTGVEMGGLGGGRRTSEAKAAEDAAALVVDTLRTLLSILGAMLASPAGAAAARDASEARSLPALAKALRRLWFAAPLSADWGSKDQALWLRDLLVVTEGSRAGIMSFYGAGLLLGDSLATFAEVTLVEAGLELDESWFGSALGVQETLRGAHWEHFQTWPADRRCGGGSDPVLSTDRLPSTMKRAWDLEGVRLTKVQAAGLGVAMMLPGSMTLGMGAIGASLLLKSARERAGGGGSPEEGDRWQAVQEKSLQHAHELLRRKTCPIEVRYVPGPNGPKLVKVCLYDLGDKFCAFPAGSLASGLDGGTGGESSARLRPGERRALQPQGGADAFRMRVYRPGTLRDAVLQEGVEVRRGDRILLVPTPCGERVRCAAEAPTAGTGETAASSRSAGESGESGRGETLTTRV